MRTKLMAAYGAAISESCWEATCELQFEVLDPSSDDGAQQVKCRLVFPPEAGHFQVANPTKKELTFLAIDHCMQIDNRIRRCDFALFDDVKICFADIKKVSRQNRSKARLDAREQLQATISHFQEQADLNSHQILAVIGLTFKQTYPVATVAAQDAKIKFQDELKADLLEGNQISF